MTRYITLLYYRLRLAHSTMILNERIKGGTATLVDMINHGHRINDMIRMRAHYKGAK